MIKHHCTKVFLICSSSGFQQQCHTCQNPFGYLLFTLQPEGPDVVGAPGFGFVHGALIGVLGFLPVHGDSSGEEDWHGGCQLLQASLCDGACLRVPLGTWGRGERVSVGPELTNVGNKSPVFLPTCSVASFPSPSLKLKLDFRKLTRYILVQTRPADALMLLRFVFLTFCWQ